MNQNKGILLVLGTAIISGFSIFINQFGVKVVNSDIYTFLKNLMAGLIVLAVILIFKEWQKVKKLKLKDLGLLTLIGLIGGSIPFILFFQGLSISSAGLGSLVHKTMFLFVAVLAIIFLKEKLNRWLTGGILLMLIGNVLLLKVNGAIWQSGDWLILSATLFWAVENIISKKAVSYLSPRLVAAGRMFFGCLFILIYLIMTGQVGLLAGLTWHQISWTVITGVILSGYLLTWYSGLKYLSVSVATTILALGAPITALLSLAQGKLIPISQGIGIGIMVAATAVIILSLKDVKPSHERS